MNYDKKIPNVISQDTIVDAICEFQLTSKVEQFSQVILGVVFTALDGEKSITQSTATGFPEVVMNAPPVFRFPHLSTISWNGFTISFSDNSVVIGCKIPYPRWDAFKAAIREVLRIVSLSGLIERINRYSLKYTDFITANSEAPFELVDLDLSLGGKNYSKSGLQLQLEIADENFVHIVGIVNPALAQTGSEPQTSGVLLSTDSIVVCTNDKNFVDIQQLNNNFDVALDKLHFSNKALFFSILSNEGLSVMGASYE